MELRQILQILWKMRRVLIVVFTVVFLTIVVGSLVITPWYEAGAKVLLQRPRAKAILLANIGIEQTDESTTVSDTERMNQIALAKVRSVADKVASDLRLSRKRIRYQILEKIPFGANLLEHVGVGRETTHKRLSAMELVSKSLLSRVFPRPYVGVAQYQDTDILEITAQSADFEQAVDIANAMASAMVAAEIKRTQEDFEGARAFIVGNLEKVRADYFESLSKMEQFVLDEKALDLDTEKSFIAEKILTLKESIEENDMTMSSEMAAIEKTKSQLNAIPLYRKVSKEKQASAIETSQKEALQDFYLTLAEAKVEYMDEHPTVKTIKAKIEKLKTMMSTETKRVLGTETITVHPVYLELEINLADYHTQMAIYKEKRASLRRMLARYEAHISDFMRKSRKYDELNRAISIADDVYTALLESRPIMRFAEALATSSISIVEPALLPGPADRSRHKYPRVLFNAVVAVLLGTFLGMGAALTVAYVGDTIKTADDLKGFPDLILLGSVPKIDRKTLKALHSGPAGSVPLEPVRAIRNSVCFACEQAGLKSFVVTSAITGEGKTFLAAGIAASAAKSGRKVLLMDCNMSNPSIHRCFELENEKGIADFLTGTVEETTILKSTGEDGLIVVTVGSVSSDSSVLIESEKMAQFIKKRSEEYDLVIIDAASFSTSYDAAILGKHTGSAVFVLGDNTTQRALFSDTLESARRASIEVIGVILNKVSLPPFIAG